MGGPLILALVAALVVLAAGGVALGVAGRRESRRARLGAVIAGPGGPAAAPHGAPHGAPVRAGAKAGTKPAGTKPGAGRNEGGELQKRLREVERRAAESQGRRGLPDRLAEAGLPARPDLFWILSALAGAAGGTVGFAAGLPAMVAVCAVAICGLGLPRLFVSTRAARRRKRFLLDLPDALEAVIRAIQSGLPVAEALAIIGRDFQGPVAREFSIAFDEQKMGLPLGECLNRMAGRMPLPEVRMLAMAVAIQTQAGGSLAESLGNLSSVIRGRERLARKVRAVSSEARVSALIMGCLPLFIMGALGAINPDYAGLLFTDGLGHVMVAFCAVWMSLGVVVMWKMVNFKV